MVVAVMAQEIVTEHRDEVELHEDKSKQGSSHISGKVPRIHCAVPD